jgi:hypothetical protein
MRSRAGQPQKLKEGNPMRGSVHFSSLLLVNLLALSTHVLWAQRTLTSEETADQLPDAPSQIAKVSEAQTRLHLSDRGLPLTFGQNQGQAETWESFFSGATGYDHRSIHIIAVPNQSRGTTEFWGTKKYFMGSTPTKWMMFAPTFGQAHHETIQGAKDLEYYGHHMPWAGSVILRLSQQARAHPHIASVLKAVHPKF